MRATRRGGFSVNEWLAAIEGACQPAGIREFGAIRSYAARRASTSSGDHVSLKRLSNTATVPKGNDCVVFDDR
jgi:hypothetical protein